MNELNLSLQGVTIFNVENKIEAMIKKLDLWSYRLSNNVRNDFLETKNETDDIRKDLIKPLKSNFRNPCPDSNNKWIKDPFDEDIKA
jgi:hypothetical protein